MSESQGHSTAMTAFTAVQRGWPRWLGVYWRVATRAAKVRHQPLEWLLAKTLLRDEKALIKLSIISFARWSVLERLPDPAAVDEDQSRGDDRGAESPPRYVLFETNFNGDNDQYLEAFSLVVPLSMRLTWRLGPFGGYRVPPIVKTSRFLRYVNDVKLPIRAYYCAYPGASTRMIRSALELERQLEDFERDYGSADPEGFSHGYRELLESVQKIRNPTLPEGTTGELSVLTRVRPGRAERLKEDLARLSDALGSNLVPGQTHHARWVVADELEKRSGMRPAEPPWLLFSAWFDGPEEAYARALYRSMGGRAQTIWRHCGYEGEGVADLDEAAKADRFWVYLNQHRVCTPAPPRGTPFQGYGGVSVDRVKSALALAVEFSDFAVTSQCLSAADLQDKWKQTFEVERREPRRERVPA